MTLNQVVSVGARSFFRPSLISWLSILPSKLNESRHSICLNLKIIDCYSQYIGKELVDADDEERLDKFVCRIPQLFLQQFH